MDPRDESATPTEQGTPEQEDAGQSSGADVLTLSLFGVMVIIASVCLVIW